MSFQVNKFDGSLLVTLADGTIDSTSSSIRLLGKKVPNYGEIIAEDFIHILENFSSSAPPPNAIAGQLWWDSANNVLKVNDGTSFVGAGSVTSGDTATVGVAGSACTDPAGSMFWNTTTSQLLVCDGTKLILIGPGGSVGNSTGSVFLSDTNNPLILVIVNSVVMAAWSNVAFNPTFIGSVLVGSSSVSIDLTASFPTSLGGLKVGLNLSANVTDNKFIGTAVTAQYSDLAERYASDVYLHPGDVVKLGGSAEITKTTEYADTDVFGVISTNPGLTLNSNAGSNETHPLVALSGRVPCKVVGKVKKGQRLTSSEIEGVATGIKNINSLSPWSIIGRSLEDKTNLDISLIEIVIGNK